MAAAKKPLPPSERLLAKVTLVSVPPLPKIDIAPPRPMVAWLPAKVTLVKSRLVSSAWMAPAPLAELSEKVDAVMARSLWCR